MQYGGFNPQSTLCCVCICISICICICVFAYLCLCICICACGEICFRFQQCSIHGSIHTGLLQHCVVFVFVESICVFVFMYLCICVFVFVERYILCVLGLTHTGVLSIFCKIYCELLCLHNMPMLNPHTPKKLHGKMKRRLLTGALFKACEHVHYELYFASCIMHCNRKCRNNP